MRVEPRFRRQVKALITKDPSARALNDALSPKERIKFNAYVEAVIGVLLLPRFRDGCSVDDLAALATEISVSHRAQQRPVNEFVIEDVLRSAFGMPTVFGGITVPSHMVSGSSAAIIRHLRDTQPKIIEIVDALLDDAETVLNQKPGGR